MRTLRRLAWVAMLTVTPAAGLVGLADSNAATAATIVGGSGAVAPAPTSATVARLSRLHHTAAREAELGRLAQLSATRPETRAYGTPMGGAGACPRSAWPEARFTWRTSQFRKRWGAQW